MWIVGIVTSATIVSQAACSVLQASPNTSAPAASTACSVRGEQLARLLPALRVEQRVDLADIDAEEHAPGRVDAARALVHERIQQAVVLGRRVPRDPAKDADRAHRAIQSHTRCR